MSKKPIMIVIDEASNITAEIVSSLVEIDFDQAEIAMLAHHETHILDSIAEDVVTKMAAPSEPVMLRPEFFERKRHHPISPKQRGGR